jgi:hypothetical protein
MKKIISLLLVVLPLFLMLSCDRNNPTSSNPNSNSDGSNLPPLPTFTVNLIIVQSFHQGGEYTIVDQKFTKPTIGYSDIWRSFTTMPGKEGCDYTAYCTYSWTDYGWTDPYALNGSFDLPSSWTVVPPTCPPDPNNPNIHPPCTGSNTLTTQMYLLKNTTYQYKLGFEGLQENDKSISNNLK